MTWGLVANFGLISIAVCFFLALGTLIFSTGSSDTEVPASARGQGEHYFAEPSTYMGGL
jgi:hypothetical protein